jgi:uncharacterized membrane protein YidH (DUF202 family)
MPLIDYNDAEITAFSCKAMILTAIPLVMVFSLCYAATRFEDLQSIFRHTLYFGGWLMFAMVFVIGIVELIYLYLH